MAITNSNKKFFWLKLKENFFSNPKIKKLRKFAGGDSYLIILQKIMLLTVKDAGVLTYEGIEKTLTSELSLILDEDEKHVDATLIFMEEMGLLQKISKNQYLLPQVVELTGSETDSATRVRKYRKQQKLLHCNTDVTPMLHDGNKTVTTEIELELELELKKDSLAKKNKKTNFQNFKKQIIETYKSKPLFQGNVKIDDTLTYLEGTKIGITSNGYLYNYFSAKELDRDNAIKVWKWLYDNQNSLLPINEEDLC